MTGSHRFLPQQAGAAEAGPCAAASTPPSSSTQTAPMLPARRQAHLWLIPILAHCTGDDGRPVPGAPPPALTELARFDAHRNIPPAVVAIREFWAPSRYNRHP